MTARSQMDWRQYTSTLALTLHMQREMTELLGAAHVGDADAAIEHSQALREMADALLADFGIEPAEPEDEEDEPPFDRAYRMARAIVGEDDPECEEAGR